MARLSSKANFGYVPLHPDVVEMIASYIAPVAYPSERGKLPMTTHRAADPCAGEGTAFGILADYLGISKNNRYVAEIHDARAAALDAVAGNVVIGDALTDVVTRRNGLQCIYMNPPFDWEGNGNGRTELAFWTRYLVELSVLQPDGIAILVAPIDTVRRSDVRELIAAAFSSFRILKLPDEYRSYREVVVIGQRRKRMRWTDMQGHVDYLAHVLQDEDHEATLSRPRRNGETGAEEWISVTARFRPLNTLTMRGEPVFQLPTPMQTDSRFVWKNGSMSRPDVAFHDVLATGGAYTSPAYTDTYNQLVRTFIRPLLPPTPRLAAFLIANGLINNSVITLTTDTGLKHYRIKGSTTRSVTEWQTERTSEKGDKIVEDHRREEYVPRIILVSLDGDGQVYDFTGDAGMVQLMSMPGMRDALLALVAEAAPPRYNLNLNQVEGMKDVLDGIISVTGRALPGYKPGLIPMQKHAVAAIVVALTEASQLRKQKRATEAQALELQASFLAAEMGCGKTPMAIAALKVIHDLRLDWSPETHNRAFTAIITGPAHMIGNAADVVAYDTGKLSELADWPDTLRDLWPDAYTVHLESPYQTARFFQHAKDHPRTPHIGLMKNSSASLSCGYSHGTDGRAMRYEGGTAGHETPEQAADRRAWHHAILHERVFKTAYEEQHKLLKQRKADQAKAPPTTGYNPSLISPRTIMRDALLKLRSHAEQQRLPAAVRPVIRTAHLCSDCGRPQMRITNNVTQAESTSTIWNRGHSAQCCWCGTKLNQWSRGMNSAKDREHVPLFDANTPEGARWSSVPRHRIMQPIAVTGVLIDNMTGEPATTESACGWIMKNGIRVRATMVPHVLHEAPPQPLPGTRPTSNPRVALGKYIKRQYQDAIDLFVPDEVHKMKSADTAMGRTYGDLRMSAHRTLPLTGTLTDGKASNLYWLLARSGFRAIIETYGFGEESCKRFVEDVGVLEHITTTREKAGKAGTYDGKGSDVRREIKERPGVSARMSELVQAHAAQLILSNMGFNMVPLTQELELLDLPPDLQGEYKAFEIAGRKLLGRGGHDAASRYHQATLQIPYAPWISQVVASSKVSGHVTYNACVEADEILPHHRAIARLVWDHYRRDRRSLVYMEHTGVMDLMPDVRDKVIRLIKAEHGVTLKIALLYANVSPGRRKGWFKDRERDGTTVVICNTRLVETGLSLIAWPNIIVMEPVYSLYVAAQAVRRPWRPIQTQPCTVTFLAYRNTMVERAMSNMATKSAALALLQGDDMRSGLFTIDASMSMYKAMSDAMDGAGGDGGWSDQEALSAAAAPIPSSTIPDFVIAGVDTTRIFATDAAHISEPPAQMLEESAQLTVQSVDSPTPPPMKIEDMTMDEFLNTPATRNHAAADAIAAWDRMRVVAAEQQRGKRPPAPRKQNVSAGQHSLFDMLCE